MKTKAKQLQMLKDSYGPGAEGVKKEVYLPSLHMLKEGHQIFVLSSRRNLG